MDEVLKVIAAIAMPAANIEPTAFDTRFISVSLRMSLSSLSEGKPREAFDELPPDTIQRM
ncbi:MAG TPA: hypothetical protein VIF62_24470 [Labilithrix sp.]